MSWLSDHPRRYANMSDLFDFVDSPLPCCVFLLIAAQGKLLKTTPKDTYSNHLYRIIYTYISQINASVAVYPLPSLFVLPPTLPTPLSRRPASPPALPAPAPQSRKYSTYTNNARPVPHNSSFSNTPFFYALNFLIGISLFLKDQWVIYTWPGKREMCLCRSACCLCWRCHLLPLYTAARGFESSKKIY